MAVARLLPGPRQFTCARGKLLGKHAASWMERRREQRHLLGLVAGIQLLNLARILRSFSAKIVSFFFFRFLFFAFCFEEEIKDRRIAIKRANKTFHAWETWDGKKFSLAAVLHSVRCTGCPVIDRTTDCEQNVILREETSREEGMTFFR